MKRFLQAAFNITLFQVVFLLILAGIKFLLNYYKVINKIKFPYFWIIIGAGFLFFIAVGIMNIIENKGHTFEEWKTDPNRTVFEKWLTGFATWGFAIPILLFYVLFLYIIAPDSVSMFLLLLAGIVIRNIFNFFFEKEIQEA